MPTDSPVRGISTSASAGVADVGDAEIRQQPTAGGLLQQNVGRFYVTVDDAAVVGKGQGAADLPEELRRLGIGQVSALEHVILQVAPSISGITRNPSPLRTSNSNTGTM